MSYDVYLEIDTGGEYPTTVCEVGNYTYNCTPQFQIALRAAGLGKEGLRDLHGRNAGEMISVLEKASSFFWDAENQSALRKLDPPNGWGRLESAREFFDKILNACRQHPKAQIKVS